MPLLLVSVFDYVPSSMDLEFSWGQPRNLTPAFSWGLKLMDGAQLANSKAQMFWKLLKELYRQLCYHETEYQDDHFQEHQPDGLNQLWHNENQYKLL